ARRLQDADAGRCAGAPRGPPVRRPGRWPVRREVGGRAREPGHRARDRERRPRRGRRSDRVAADHGGEGVPRAADRPVTSGRLAVIALAVVLGLLVLYPIAFLLVGSLTPQAGSPDAFPTLEGYRRALNDPQARSAVVTTMWLSALRALLATGLALALAWAVTRTNVPGARFFHASLLVSFF